MPIRSSANTAGSAITSSCKMAPSSGPTASVSRKAIRASGTRSCNRSRGAGGQCRGPGQRLHRPRQHGETHIARGAKIDNLVQVGHGSPVGENTLLCAQSAWRVRPPSVRTSSSPDRWASPGTAPSATVPSPPRNRASPAMLRREVVSGYPAIDNKLWLRCSAVFHRLPELMKAVRRAPPSKS